MTTDLPVLNIGGGNRRTGSRDDTPSRPAPPPPATRHTTPKPRIGYYLGTATNGIRRSVLTAGLPSSCPEPPQSCLPDRADYGARGAAASSSSTVPDMTVRTCLLRCGSGQSHHATASSRWTSVSL